MQCWNCSNALSKLRLQGLHKHEIAGISTSVVFLTSRLINFVGELA